MLQVGSIKLTETEAKSHFASWCVSSAPLILGYNLADEAASSRAQKIVGCRKAIEVNLDVEKYEARLQSTSADDPDLVKLEAKLRKLRLQQEYLNELPPPQAARSRPGGSVEESGAGESNEAAPVMVMDVASSGRTSSKKGSSLCSVS